MLAVLFGAGTLRLAGKTAQKRATVFVDESDLSEAARCWRTLSESSSIVTHLGNQSVTMPERPSRLRSLFFNLITFVVSCVIALALLEVLLRVHNPFQARIKGNRIVLLTNKTYKIKNDIIPTLDPVVAVTRNSLGPPPPVSSNGR